MSRWTGGNKVQLLENGEAYFPAVFAAIDAARHEVLIETFILFEDKVGQQLQQTLIRAAQRGVQIDLLVDGFGSSDLTGGFVGALAAAGVRLRVFDPARRVLGIRFNLLRRMHRKLVVVDGRLAFVGGINFSADHLEDFGPEAKQDYAVAVEGPIVGPIREFALRQIQAPRRVLERFRRPPRPPVAGNADTLFVTRDNQVHRNAIERHYRVAIRSARQQVVIANAYFFPGWLLLRELRRAARRGVDVRLILQGQPDMPIVKTAASMLYAHLQRDGVRIFEYCKRPLHGKVAVVDERWATVGSSNLDPLSLSLNLEANLIVRDAAFNARLSERLHALMAESCREVPAAPPPRWPLWQQLRSTLIFHVLRGFPVWATRLPAHEPRLEMHAASSGQGD
jgi:cardiolipin synthase A/B